MGGWLVTCEEVLISKHYYTPAAPLIKKLLVVATDCYSSQPWYLIFPGETLIHLSTKARIGSILTLSNPVIFFRFFNSVVVVTTVGLFEPSYHHALIPPMAAIANEAAGNVRIFTTEENRDHAAGAMDNTAGEAYEWIVKDNDESFRSFFERVERATLELDVIWTITPYGAPAITQELLTFSPRCPAVTFLHDTSRFVPPNHRLLSELFAWHIKAFSGYLPAPVRGRAWNQAGQYLVHHILNNYDCVLPLYPPIAEYVEHTVEPDALVDWFLPEFHRPPTAEAQDCLQITVPGRVTKTLRNYDLLFELLDTVNNARERLSICLLGSPVDPSGKDIIDRCERYEQRDYDIHYYPSHEWIPAVEFTRQMARTDLVFSPVNIRGENKKGGGNRIRGRTITSGAIGDAVRIGRPLVMPDEFTVAPEFKKLITTYEGSADAATLIESWVASVTTRQELQQEAERTAQQFSLKRQAARFEQICQRVINASRPSIA